MSGRGKEPLLEEKPKPSGPMALLAPLATIQRMHDVPDEEFDVLEYREKVRRYYEAVSEANYTVMPPLIAILYGIIGGIWFAMFYYVVRDPSLELFSDTNMRKFVLYNVLHGVLGFGATCGALGCKFKVPFGACGLTFLTPGTLCSPLFPGVVGLLFRTPGKRSCVAVLAFAIYVAALTAAIVDPSSGNVAQACGAFFVATCFDATIFFASRGEHYGYHMICMMFPDWISGCQWVQLMLWIMVGFSKVGPWFKYAIQILVKDAIWTCCLPSGFSARLFCKDYPRDHSPSSVSKNLAHMGALGEWVLPLCCLARPGTVLNDVGVYGMIAYHGFIWCTLPTASVFEWQYYTQFMTFFLYKRNAFALPTSPALIAFLLVVLVVLPVVGQLEPCLVPFLMAYRQYAGNWRLGWWMVRKSAMPKLEKLKAYNSLFTWQSAPKELGGRRQDFLVLCSFMPAPQFRGMFSVMEKFFEDTGYRSTDFEYTSSFVALNALFGWDLAVGWLWCRECFREALVDVCGLEAGDVYFLQMEPVKFLPPYTLTYRLMDAVKGPLDAEVVVDIPYSVLEGTHPMGVHLEPSQMRKGKSIRGTFLSTYY